MEATLHRIRKDDLPLDELLALSDFEDDGDRDDGAAPAKTDLDLLEARVRAARLAGA